MAIHMRILLKNLEINPANDRHGDLGSEAEAMEWLLVNKTEKMKDLLDDIANKNGVIVEEPLVMKKPNENKYVVYDGNRRVTCLKLLHGLVPVHINNPLQKKVEAIKTNQSLDLDAHVECRVETDIDVVNDILELRHIPGTSGAGQLKWDGHEKENFLERVGKSKKLNFAREMNRLLIAGGYLAAGDRIPLSTFNRLFASKEMKRRAGVDVQNEQIQLINDRDAAYKAMTRIAKDMIAGNKTLDDVWDNDRKAAYLDELEKEGILPSAKNRLGTPEVVAGNDESGEAVAAPQKPPRAPNQRDYLLPTNLPTPEHNASFSLKFCQLFYELQNTLRFSLHGIAISISFRTFLEILTDTYLRAHGLDETGSLARRVKTAFVDMQKKAKMPEVTRAFVEKISDANEYFSINTLHKVVHYDMQVSEDDLRSYVNNLDAYLREAVASINSQQKTQAA